MPQTAMTSQSFFSMMFRCCSDLGHADVQEALFAS